MEVSTQTMDHESATPASSKIRCERVETNFTKSATRELSHNHVCWENQNQEFGTVLSKTGNDEPIRDEDEEHL